MWKIGYLCRPLAEIGKSVSYKPEQIFFKNMQNNSKNKWAKKAVRWMRNLFLFFLLSSVGAVIILKYMPVYITPLMLIRSVQNVVKGDSPRFYHEWVPLNDISRWLPLAVVASEDNLFMTHHGFDF